MSAPGWLLRVLGGLPSPLKSVGTQAPAPLTESRVSAFLNARGYRFTTDEDGDLTGTWDGHRFWFLLLGDDEEVIQVRGRWSRSLPLEQRAAAEAEERGGTPAGRGGFPPGDFLDHAGAFDQAAEVLLVQRLPLLQQLLHHFQLLHLQECSLD